MSLEALNDDVLYNVLSYCWFGTPTWVSAPTYEHYLEPHGAIHTLSALCKTSRRLNHIATPYLYKHLHFATNHGPERNDLISRHFQAFHRTVKAEARLGQLVHSFHLHLQARANELVVDQAIADVLGHLPHLRALQIRSRHHRHKYPCFLETVKLPSLGTLRLHGQWKTFETLSRCQILAGVEEIMLDGIYRTSQPGDWLETHLRFPTVRRLCLPSTCMPFKTLENLIGSFPNLTHLAMRYPGDMQPTTKGVCTGLDNLLWGPLSPRRLEHALYPLREILEELYITDFPYAATNELHRPPTRGDMSLSHDSSKLDLSNYPRLRKLNVPALCFFSTMVACSPHNSIAEVLPPQLEELILYFAYTSLDHTKHIAELPTFSSGAYSWILDLAIRKATQFPHLRILKVREKPPRRRHGYDKLRLYPWNPPWELQEVMENAAIELDTAVRANMRSPPH